MLSLPTTPVVTISFAGLMLLDFKDKGQCHARIIPCPNHQLAIDIQKIKFDPGSGLPLKASLEEHSLDPKKDLIISGVNGGVSLHTNKGKKFDKETGEGDPFDFRWVLNLEGGEFGGQRLTALKPAFDTPQAKPIKQAIHLTDGKFYTENLTADMFVSKSLTDGALKFIGKVAFRVGVEIPLKKGESVYIKNVSTTGTKAARSYSRNRSLSNGQGGSPVKELPYEPDSRYLVTIENLCSPASTGSDFPFYYDAITTVNNDRFDVVRAVGNRDQDLGQRVPGHEGLTLDSDQQNCLVTSVGNR